jgi:hypothetical protein
MKAHNCTSQSLTLPLPAFVLHPLAAMGISALHVYLAAGHLSKLFSGPVQWTDIWKGFGALAGAYIFAALASGLPEVRIKTFSCIRIRRG